MESSAQVQETLHRTASVASDLEVRLGATSVAQEQSHITAERAQMFSEKAMRETQMLQIAQQATAAELKDEVAKIGICIQEQSERTLLQEQTRRNNKIELWSSCLNGCKLKWILRDSRWSMRRNWQYRHNQWCNLL